MRDMGLQGMRRGPKPVRTTIPDGNAERPDFMFTTLNGTQVRYSRFRKDVFDPAVKKAGLDGLTPHGLRHTFAALAVKAGANPKVLQVAMGHSDIRLTLDTYGGLFGDDLDSLAESMNAAVQGSGSQTNVVSRRIGHCWHLRHAGNLPIAAIVFLEPPRGFEPRTYALRVRCSTPELRRLAPRGRSMLATHVGTYKQGSD